MTDSISGSTPLLPNTPQTNVPSGVDSSGKPVTGGYSDQNTTSQVSGQSANTSNIQLDAPDLLVTGSSGSLNTGATTETFTNYTKLLESFKFDLADTQNLLMLYRGKVQENKINNNAQSIKEFVPKTAEGRKILQELEVLSSSKASIQSEILAKKEEIRGYEETSKTTTDATKKTELDKSIQEVNKALAKLYADDKIVDLQIVNKQAQFVLAGGASVLTQRLKVKQVPADVKAALSTGEEELDRLKLELKQQEVLFHKADFRRRVEELELKSFEKQLYREHTRDMHKLTIDQVSGELRSVLLPKQLRSVLQVLSLTSSTQTSTSDTLPISELSDDQLYRQLAVMLLEPAVQNEKKEREPKPSAGTEAPQDQPYMGDSMSLEGANNPQAQTIILLQERMADIKNALYTGSGGTVILNSDDIKQQEKMLEIEAEVLEMLEQIEEDRARATEARKRSDAI